MQDGNSSDLLFSIADLIAIISAEVTLDPGDVIVTGTPSGVGVFREPQVFLEPGDLVRVEVERIGSLTNPVTDEDGDAPAGSPAAKFMAERVEDGRDAMTESSESSESAAAIAAATSVDLRIPRTMRALVKTKPEPGAELLEVPVPHPGPGEVLIRVEATSPLRHRPPHLPLGRVGAGPDGQLPAAHLRPRNGRPRRRARPRHRRRSLSARASPRRRTSWTGLATSAGPAASTSAPISKIVGVDADGAFAEYVCLPERNGWPSEGLEPEIAAIQEPMGNAVFATFVEEITTASVAILGCGPIGLMAAAICRFAGASRIFATDVMPHRREMAAHGRGHGPRRRH